ncbi:MAG: ion transporter [Gammaproteobacteria bacterium]
MIFQTQWPAWRNTLKNHIEANGFQRTIISLILINAAILGMETDASIMAQWGDVLLAVDSIILTVFVVEIVLRLAVHRLAFFRDPWSVFDFLVVSIALVPASGPLQVLRALRVLRVLRLLTMVPSMRRVVGGMLAAIPGLGSVAAIMIIIFYVTSVIATNLFGEQFPLWFGSLANSSYTLFQVMTLESWSMGIVRPVMEVYPHAWAFFVPFILIATFTMLNLFIAVIVSAVQQEEHKEFEETQRIVTERVDEDSHALQKEISDLRAELRELKEILSAKR